MIVAITGANGFIGSNLMRHFAAQGFETRAIVRRDFVSGAAVDAITGADVIVHAAGATRAPTATGLHRANVELTKGVVELARQGRARRMVFISSQAVAGPSADNGTPMTEAMTAQPIEDYGRSKLAAEDVVRAAADLSYVILRPASVYGPRDRDFLALFRLARLGVVLHPGNRDQRISIVHVDDLARAVMGAAMNERAAGETMFVANDSPVTWRELFAVAARSAGRTIVADVNVPHAIVAAAAQVGDAVARFTGRAGLITSEKVALASPRSWVCSNALAKSILGFAPQISIEDGFAETYRWYRTQHWL